MKATFEIDLLSFKIWTVIWCNFDCQLTLFSNVIFFFDLISASPGMNGHLARVTIFSLGRPIAAMHWWFIPLIYFRLVGLLLLYIWWGQNGWRGWKTTGRIVHQKALHLNWTRTPLDPQKSQQQEIGPRLPLFSTKDESGRPIFLIRLSELLKYVYYERRASHSQAAKAKQERKVSPLLSGPFTLVHFSTL